MLTPLPVEQRAQGKLFIFKMARIPYEKPALKYNEQIQQLQDRGLLITNIPRATHLLESISYYRLSGYWYPFLKEKNLHIFKPGSTFQDAFNLYCFDRKLRVMIIRELEKIEISIRAKMIYELSHSYDGFWYKEQVLFKNDYKQAVSLDKLKKEFARSDEEFIKSFRIKYTNDLPPSWMLLEIASFGSISSLYGNLKSSRAKRNIAKHFGLNDVTFASWLHSIVYLRNVCAHHSRLWNRVLSIQPVIPQSTSKPWLEESDANNKKMYFALSMILYLLQTINPNNSFVERFKALLVEYPNVDVNAMGFKDRWEEQVLWQ